MMKFDSAKYTNPRTGSAMAWRLLAALVVFVAALGATLLIGNSGISFSRRWAQDLFTSKPVPQPALIGVQKPFYDAIGVSALPSQSVRDEDVPASESFTVELAIVGTATEADTLLDSLLAKGITAFYTPVNQDGRVYFRIRKGFFGNESLARQTLADLARKKIAGKVVRLR